MNKNSHILIVDDDNRLRELIKEYLEEKNIIVSTANDAEEASEKIKLVDFEIIVLDIMMPGESGLILTKKLRKNISTPIILLTAKEVRRFGIRPVIALLSYSNFGSTRDIETKKLQRVVKFFN